MNVVPMTPLAHWYVILTVAGQAWRASELAAAINRLLEERPLLQSCRYAPDTVELRYWEQADDVEDAAAMALRLWGEHRTSAGLPDWHVVGLEVLDRDTYHRRRVEHPPASPPVVAVAETRPL